MSGLASTRSRRSVVRSAAVATAILLGVAAGSAHAGVITQMITVDGTATVAFAGQVSPIAPLFPWVSGDYFGDLGDPDTIPPFVAVFTATLSVSATGSWGHGSSAPQQSGPEGRGIQDATRIQYEAFGISILDGVDLNTLLGVFTDDSGPIPGSAPGRLTFGVSDMTTPLLNQTFAIGSGLSGIVVPTGATRLYFGLHDGYEWTNNVGSVDVTIRQVPEPTAVLLLGTGLLGIGYKRKRRELDSPPTESPR